MRFIKRYINYLVLLICLVGLIGLFFTTFVTDSEVTIRDPILETTIREILEQSGKPLHSIELKKITELDLTGKGITSLEGIQHLSNLTVLNLENNKVQDVAPLATLRKLRRLNLINNGITDLEKANFAVLAYVPIKQLYLDYNVVIINTGEAIWLSDISVLGQLTTLRELSLSNNKISDISSLSRLVNLKTLFLDGNLIQDVSVLQNLKFIRTLSLRNNNVKDLAPLADLHQLKSLTLDNLPLGEGISLLSDKNDLEELSLAGAGVSDITPLKDLRNLKRLNLRDNDIVDLSPLSNHIKLEYLNIQSNESVESILPLVKLKQLKELDIQNVPVGVDIHALANMSRLEFLDARNCAITDTKVFGALMAKGALQDYPAIGKTASIDLRDNPISVNGDDAYGPIRSYWENISDRMPFLLPDYAPLLPPEFSMSAGFYDQPFELMLTTDLENAEIFYTLDGSEPTRDSIRYTNPFTIKNRAGEPNIISEISEVSPRWVSPGREVYKVTTVRARVISSDGANHSPVVTNTFIVDGRKRYTLPVISLVTNSEYFFDHKYGIYVMGDLYDQLFDPYSGVNPWERAANYTQKGQEWERPIHIEYFDVNGELGFAQDATVRIHGAASRERSQKSLRIYAKCSNDCEESFEYELFPGLTSTASGSPVTQFKTFLLRNSGNDWESTMFRDALTQSLVEHTHLDIQAYQPAVVFLNGEYWGIHNLRERLDEYYIQNHYGINPEDVVILADNAVLSAGEPGDEQHFLDMLAFIETHDMKDPENYAYVQTLMDVENFIDYQILEIYSDNGNWPHVNINYWRKKTETFEPGAPYGQDGRWRWMVFDTDFSFGFNDGTKASANNNIMNAIRPGWHEWAGFLLRSLLENPDFEATFINRFCDHLNTSFAPHRVLEKIDYMQATLESEMKEHLHRWRGEAGTLQAWKDNVDIMRYFAETRPQFMRAFLGDYFNLGEPVNVYLATDKAMGYFRVNSIDIIENTPGVVDPASWSGVFFTGIPIEVTAVPYPGYEFEKWEGINEGNIHSQRLSLILAEDISLKAVFSSED